MYQEIAKVINYIVLGLGTSIFLHFVYCTFMAIYKGVVSLERIPFMIFCSVLGMMLVTVCTVVSIIVTSFVWPVIMFLCVCFAIHPRIRCNMMERAMHPVTKIFLIPVTVVYSIHLAITECLVNTIYSEFGFEYHDIV